MKAWVIDIVCWLFVILFLYVGFSKLLDMDRFDWALSKSPVLRSMHRTLSYIIPATEIFVALLLLFSFFTNLRIYRRWGLIGACMLMTVFTIYIGYMLTFRIDRPCTCGGIIAQMNWHQHMYFNLLLTCISFISIRVNSKLVIL